MLVSKMLLNKKNNNNNNSNCNHSQAAANMNKLSQDLLQACSRQPAPSIDEIRNLIQRVQQQVQTQPTNDSSSTLSTPPPRLVDLILDPRTQQRALHILCDKNTGAPTTVQAMDLLLGQQRGNSGGEERNPFLSWDVLGQTPLHIACRRRVQHLQHNNPTSNTNLHYLEVIHELVSRSPESVAVLDHSMNSSRDNNSQSTSASDIGQTPLHIAAAAADLAVVQILVTGCPQACKVSSGTNQQEKLLPIHSLFLGSAAKETHPPCEFSGSNELVFKLLPVLRSLIQACPETLLETTSIYTTPSSLLEEEDDTMTTGGRLPLHVACDAQLPGPVIQCLIDACPNSVWKKDAQGRLPLEHWKRCSNMRSRQEADISHLLERQGSSQRLNKSCSNIHNSNHHHRGTTQQRRSHNYSPMLLQSPNLTRQVTVPAMPLPPLPSPMQLQSSTSWSAGTDAAAAAEADSPILRPNPVSPLTPQTNRNTTWLTTTPQTSGDLAVPSLVLHPRPHHESTLPGQRAF